MSKNKSLLTQNLSRRSVIKGGTVAALAASSHKSGLKKAGRKEIFEITREAVLKSNLVSMYLKQARMQMRARMS